MCSSLPCPTPRRNPETVGIATKSTHRPVDTTALTPPVKCAADRCLTGRLQLRCEHHS